MLWFSTEKDLPKCDEKFGVSEIVLCLDARNGVGFGIYVKKGQLQNEGWFVGGGVGEDSVTITHWMPIHRPADCDYIAFETAMGKQRPLSPIKNKKQEIRYTSAYSCPTCNGSFSGTGIAEYCYHCGQKLEWDLEK